MDAAEVKDMLDVAGHVKVSSGHLIPNQRCYDHRHTHSDDSIHLAIVQLSPRVKSHGAGTNSSCCRHSAQACQYVMLVLPLCCCVSR
jgi:hypothetical protein